MTLSKLISKTFNQGNVAVTGLRGTGKDMLMSNVAIYCHKPYISNIDYGGKFIPLEMAKLDIPNTSADLRNGNITPYEYPYPEKADIYISDASIYYPNYDYATLNKEIDGVATFCCLSRHIAEANIFFNTQNLNRIWDKFREQTDIYIRCLKCRVIFGKIVIQRIRLYNVADSCINNVPPCPDFSPLEIFSGKVDKMTRKLLRINYTASHGEITEHTLIYLKRSKYDTRHFKRLLQGK